MRDSNKVEVRRKFLRMLATSPLLAFSGFAGGGVGRLQAAGLGAAQMALEADHDATQTDDLITSPEQALDIMDFREVARKNLIPAHFAFLETGTDDDATMRANREGFTHLKIRARRLVDVSKVDMSVKLFGSTWKSPITLAPIGGMKTFHPDGEIAVAKAARAKGNLFIFSTESDTPIEAVAAARDATMWFQLYPTNVWEVTRALVKRAEAVGCPVIVLTTELSGGHNEETLERAKRLDTHHCADCHEDTMSGKRTTLDTMNGKKTSFRGEKPMFNGLDVSKVTTTKPNTMTWDYVKRLRDATTKKLVLKGLVTRDDAQLAVKHGVDGIIVSNHGGRAESRGRGTIERLPEVLEGAAGKIPVLIDGGFRRGTDVFKALALGAKAISIGRPYCWGLAAFGEPGVEALLGVLEHEFQMIMQGTGVTSVDQITRAYLV